MSKRMVEMSKGPILTADEIAYAYCENESQYGFPCRVSGCPHCGGPEERKKKKKRARK